MYILEGNRGNRFFRNNKFCWKLSKIAIAKHFWPYVKEIWGFLACGVIPLWFSLVVVVVMGGGRNLWQNWKDPVVSEIWVDKVEAHSMILSQIKMFWRLSQGITPPPYGGTLNWKTPKSMGGLRFLKKKWGTSLFWGDLTLHLSILGGPMYNLPNFFSISSFPF